MMSGWTDTLEAAFARASHSEKPAATSDIWLTEDLTDRAEELARDLAKAVGTVRSDRVACRLDEARELVCDALSRLAAALREAGDAR